MAKAKDKPKAAAKKPKAKAKPAAPSLGQRARSGARGGRGRLR